MREFSEIDGSDGKLIIPSEKFRPIENNLLKLNSRGYIVLTKLADSDKRDLILNVALVWAMLDIPKERFEKDMVVGTQPFITSIADAIRSLE